MNSDHYRKMYISLYPQISSFVAVNNYQSDNFHHKTNTPLVALGEWPTEDTLSREVEIRKSYLKLEFTEHITRTLMENLSSPQSDSESKCVFSLFYVQVIFT